ncbi:hypothetical protein [Sinosporangium album]|uniref:hypothetical protein n=1 Tax=Sinosporangium album TaxID=504805 RepID=UPI003B833023
MGAPFQGVRLAPARSRCGEPAEQRVLRAAAHQVDDVDLAARQGGGAAPSTATAMHGLVDAAHRVTGSAAEPRMIRASVGIPLDLGRRAFPRHPRRSA